jgi:hypothetical protein
MVPKRRRTTELKKVSAISESGSSRAQSAKTARARPASAGVGRSCREAGADAGEGLVDGDVVEQDPLPRIVIGIRPVPGLEAAQGATGDVGEAAAVLRVAGRNAGGQNVGPVGGPSRRDPGPGQRRAGGPRRHGSRRRGAPVGERFAGELVHQLGGQLAGGLALPRAGPLEGEDAVPVPGSHDERVPGRRRSRGPRCRGGGGWGCRAGGRGSRWRCVVDRSCGARSRLVPAVGAQGRSRRTAARSAGSA